MRKGRGPRPVRLSFLLFPTNSLCKMRNSFHSAPFRLISVHVASSRCLTSRLLPPSPAFPSYRFNVGPPSSRAHRHVLASIPAPPALAHLLSRKRTPAVFPVRPFGPIGLEAGSRALQGGFPEERPHCWSLVTGPLFQTIWQFSSQDSFLSSSSNAFYGW